MTVYYPYQVRTVMPMTGPSVVQCNYADPEITVMFSSDGVPTEVMEKGIATNWSTMTRLMEMIFIRWMKIGIFL